MKPPHFIICYENPSGDSPSEYEFGGIEQNEAEQKAVDYITERPGLQATIYRAVSMFSPLTQAVRREEFITITITQPIGSCDGSRHYAYDASREDGRGAKLTTPCPGCRACQ